MICAQPRCYILPTTGRAESAGVCRIQGIRSRYVINPDLGTSAQSRRYPELGQIGAQQWVRPGCRACWRGVFAGTECCVPDGGRLGILRMGDDGTE
jgi:hypothetical protein